ncbi:hypothetical protein DPMN_105333 [Dreissena polymorpha]|uniref:Uncharacterized protein n=1 Tax=Dreissena polymorpha TaxID=45954 RepID=A0A9D4K326_DREPO|nr:hypothetical protein DPMN_105333 [Dreissena polymorpha]
MAPRASMTQGIYMVLPDDASALAESYGYNQSRMSSGDVLSSSQARMSSGEALGYNQTRMSSGDVLSTSQARISSGEALGYNQSGMSSGDVIDSSQAGMISAGNTQGFIQARKTSTAMFSATEHRQSSAAFLLSNGLAMTSPDAGFAHGSNEHMPSTHTGEFSQARKASTIVIDSSERRRPSEDIIEQGQADTSSSLVLGSGEQRISSGDILGANAVRSSAVYNRRQSSVVTVQTREYYSSTEPPSSIDVKYLSNALSADGKEAQYIHDEDTVSGDDVMLVVNEEPTVTKNSRYFQSTDMVSEGGAIHGRHAFGNGERAQTGAFAYVEGGDTGESSTDVNFVLMGLPAPSEDTRAFDNDMDGEPTVVTGIQTKKGSKLSTSGVTDAGYGGMETASVEKRTSSSGMETKYVFSEEHSSGGGESKYLESHGGDISGVREFDNVIDGEPTIVTGIK